ncbi:MAG: DNA mismatch repair protein MutS [Candidatus Izimaplasma sp.]|nr:DNA mismatch repair protein MutS [Candidatus Izimaplasma bacterium]
MDGIDKTQYTPMMRQYLTIKEDYEDAIVFFRLGDFYEMFFSDAYLASRELEIQLTARDAGADERVPMCGVPHHSADRYIEKLIQKGYKVAICEQVEDASKTTKLVKRDVVRLITPGTYMEQTENDNHYIAALGIHPYLFTVSFLDVATGDSFSLELPKDKTILVGELMQINAKELVVSHVFDEAFLKEYIKQEGIVVSIQSDTDIPDMFDHLLKSIPTKEAKKTYRRLLKYIIDTQKRHLMHIKPVEVLEATSYLRLDSNSVRNLELTETMRQAHRNGSLFWLIDKCKTAMGSRFLKRQLLRPLVNKDVLETRYDTIDILNKEFIIKDELRDALTDVYDLERIIGRVAYGNANAKDLVQLRRSLGVIPYLKEQLKTLNTNHTNYLSERLDTCDALHQELSRGLVDDPPLTIKEGGIIKNGYDDTLDDYREISSNVKDFLQSLEKSEREKTQIKKLKIGYNRVFGYYIEVPKGQIENVKDEFGYTRKQTLANSERYITETLKEKEKKIINSEEKQISLEYNLFLKIREFAKEHIQHIQTNAGIISEIDMMIAFSIISEKYQLARPTLVKGHTVSIEASFHPVVSEVLEDVFIPNDITMDKETDILLITGPNMSGKSTYMRQLAITVILAQIGSFVPAKKAKLPIFDAIYTRIGAADDLVSGKSTFMVEMLDANRAISGATKDSLILFDEIGRGTATYDGMALAQSIIEYIHEEIGCKTLFSTHYHELTNLDHTLKRLKNVHVSATNEAGHITFLHKVKDGPTDKSYGINVAKLADLPSPLIKRAKHLLNHLEFHHKRLEQDEAVTLFDFEEEDTIEPRDDIRARLKEVDLDECTPLEALNILNELMHKLK